MSHPGLLRFQIKQAVGSGIHLNGNPLYNFHTVIGKLVHLVGIIGQKPQRFGS